MGDQTNFDYERSDIESGGIAWIAAGLGLLVFAVPLLMPLVYPQSMRHISPAAPPALRADTPELEIDPSEYLQRFDRASEQLSDSYGWVDREHGVIQIPVARAVERLLHQGLPGWPTP